MVCFSMDTAAIMFMAADRLHKCPALLVQKLAGASEPAHANGAMGLLPVAVVIASFCKASGGGGRNVLSDSNRFFAPAGGPCPSHSWPKNLTILI